MQSLSENDYRDFTDFFDYVLPDKFKKKLEDKNEPSRLKVERRNLNKPSSIYNTKDYNYLINKTNNNIQQFNCKNNEFKLTNRNCRTIQKSDLSLFTNQNNRQIFIDFFSRDKKLFETMKKELGRNDKLRRLYSNINNPANFIQFIREISGIVYVCPPGEELAKNDIINFIAILPILIKKPKILNGGKKSILNCMLENRLPIPKI
jgi:hypothetical protein